MGQTVRVDGRHLIIGREIRRVRLEQGLSQNELARRAGFNQAIISSAELGLLKPDRYLGRIAACLGMEVSELTSLVEICPHCAGTGVRDEDPRADSLRKALLISRRG